MSCRRGEGIGARCVTGVPACAEPLSGGAHDSLRVPRPDPPLLPSIIFPLGPPSCGDECRAERTSEGHTTFLQAHSEVVCRHVLAEGRKCEGGAGNGFGSRVGY